MLKAPKDQILVIDDQRDVLDHVVDLLQRRKFAVEGTVSGAEGLRYFQENADHLSLVVLDLDLGCV